VQQKVTANTNHMPTTSNVYILMSQTKAVQQAMDQKDFHRAVELRGRSEIHFSA